MEAPVAQAGESLPGHEVRATAGPAGHATQGDPAPAAAGSHGLRARSGFPAARNQPCVPTRLPNRPGIPDSVRPSPPPTRRVLRQL